MDFYSGRIIRPLFAQPSSPILPIPQLAQEPVIDGNLSEWREYAHSDGVWDMRRITQTPFYALDRGARNRLTIHGNEGSLQSDLSARYYLAWDETHFYFGAEVNDNVNDTEDPDPADKRWYFRDAICWFMEGPRDQRPNGLAKAIMHFALPPRQKSFLAMPGGGTVQPGRRISKNLYQTLNGT